MGIWSRNTRTSSKSGKDTQVSRRGGRSYCDPSRALMFKRTLVLFTNLVQNPSATTISSSLEGRETLSFFLSEGLSFSLKIHTIPTTMSGTATKNATTNHIQACITYKIFSLFTVVIMSSLEIRDYDPLDVVKTKYALSKKGSLPEYFIFPTDDVRKLVDIIRNDPKKILDIRSVLKGVPASELENVYKTKTKRKWVLKQKKTGVALVWLLVNKGVSARDVKFLNVGYFDQESRVQEYLEYVETERKKLQKLLEEFEASASRISEFGAKTQRDFRIEREARLSEVSSGQTLLELFDRIQCSKEVPFVSLQTGGRNLYKSYSRIPPPPAWLAGRGGLEDFGTGDVILMKVLSFSSSEFSENNPSQMERIDKFYDEVIWTPDINTVGKQNVLVDVTIREGMTYSDVEQRVTESFVGEPVTFENTRTSTVKASYYIYDLLYKRAEFVDILLRNPLTSKFFFSNETLSTTLAKSRFYVYFDPLQKRDPTDVSVAFLPASSKTTDTKIRIARAKSEGEISAFNSLFLSVLEMYSQELPGATALYDRFIPSTQRFKEKQKKGGDDEELRNIVNLRRTYPDLFSKKYSKQCTAAVSILSREEAEELKRKKQKNRVLEYPKGSGMFFGCKSKKHKDHIYPALRFNVRPFSEKYEFVPCCYTEPSEKPRRHPEGCTERVFGADKKELPENTCGYIPASLERFFKVAIDSPVTVLRHSVDVAPDSMLYCIEMARSKKFFSLEEESERAAYIKQKRLEISEMENFSIGRQELYDFRSTEEIRQLLRTSTFIDSLLFARILEKFYDVNIVVFTIDKDRVVSFEIPRHAKSWIAPYFDPTKKTVVLLRVPWKDMPYPSQYEVLFTVPSEQTDNLGKKKKPGEPKSKVSIDQKDFTFRDKKIISSLFKSLYATNRVWSVSIADDGLEVSQYEEKNPKTHPLLSLATEQHIDSFGKCRTLFFGTVSLIVSPMAPLDIPEKSKVFTTSRLSKAKEFLEKLGMTAVSQELDQEGRTTGIHVSMEGSGLDLCFLPLVSQEKIKDVPVSKSITIPKGESSLKVFRTKRTVASRLVEYGISLSVELGRFLESQDFVIDKNFDMDQVKSEPQSLIVDKKLRVPSQVFIERIKFAVSSSIKNLPFSKIQTEQFKAVSDFAIVPNTVVFLSERALNIWVKNFEAQDTTLTVKTRQEVGTTLPYFFDDSKLLLVQNVKDGKRETAGFIVDRWRKKGANPGYEAKGTFDKAVECSKERKGNCVSENSQGSWSARLQ
ncbi:putative early transcription factor large subunit [Brazilian marseillevirus]|uniref:putative early transcription factor large subunit n=1 Tax=Brazilian marseillevirus TaxID=1813599 RepID=UPI0007841547|nr:putative early transcription factor large subunit [Brazilian marseillevirus]AMQ10873.1 putative early transcription factor large subunit [Brazilian marseillevirus]